jgi:predicted HTH transcriptional regulator
MYQWHALPENWEHMEYREFLEQRRELMAQVIAEGYRTLTGPTEVETIPEEIDLNALVLSGESEAVEFKCALRVNLHTGGKDPRIEHAILRTLAGFLNTNGGTLVVGVADDGTPIGIETDGFPNEDEMSHHLVNIVKGRLGSEALAAMHAHFEDYENTRAMIVRCGKSASPVFVRDGDIERFYIRTGPSTTELSASQTQEYIKQRYKG